MSDTPSGSSAGLLLVILGVLVLTQTLVGGLVERITGSATSPASSKSTSTASGPQVGLQAITPAEANAAGQAAAKLPADIGNLGAGESANAFRQQLNNAAGTAGP